MVKNQETELTIEGSGKTIKIFKKKKNIFSCLKFFKEVLVGLKSAIKNWCQSLINLKNITF